MSSDHECVFVEEREPSGRLVLPPCLVCEATALDALEQLHREREREAMDFRRRAHEVSEDIMPLVGIAWIGAITLDAARDLADGVDGVVDVLALVIVCGVAVLAVMFGALFWRIRRRRRASG